MTVTQISARPAPAVAVSPARSAKPVRPAKPVRSAKPPIVTRELLLMFVADFGALTSFFLLLSVVPLYAADHGAGQSGAGLATSALTFATVAGELGTPRLVRRLGYRWAFAAGVLLLGLPSLALATSPDLAVIVAVSVLRGLGFALTVVAGSATIAALIPPERRGEGLGLYGIGAGLPSVVALPAGVWLLGHVGYAAVFEIGAVAALTGFAALPAFPGRPARSPAAAPASQPAPAPQPAPASQSAGASRSGPATAFRRHGGVLSGLRTPALSRPASVFGVTAMAAGAALTFVPLALGHAPSVIAPLALLAQPAAGTVARWQAGRYGDRHDPARLLVPGVALTAFGVLAVAVTLVACPVAVIAAMAVFGIGFGIIQNSTLALMYSRCAGQSLDTASAMWNVAYDAGLGLGAAGFGVLAAHGSYQVAFAISAALVLAALGPARRDRPTRRARPGR